MLLTIAGVISAIAIINAVYPAVTRSTGALASASGTVDERIRTNVSVIHAVGELSSTSTWVDTNGNGYFDFFVWVKNVGEAKIGGIDTSDVFFGQEGSVERVTYTTSTSTTPRWTYSVEGGGEWVAGATVKITVAFNDGCPTCYKAPGTYYIKIITPNGVSTEKYFSM